MKHIKKRFLLESDEQHLKLDKEKFEVLELDKNFDHRVLNGKKKSIALIWNEKKMYGGFVHRVDGKNYIFPDKRQIQESIDFKTKITEVIADATGKDFF